MPHAHKQGTTQPQETNLRDVGNAWDVIQWLKILMKPAAPAVWLVRCRCAARQEATNSKLKAQSIYFGEGVRAKIRSVGASDWSTTRSCR